MRYINPELKKSNINAGKTPIKNYKSDPSNMTYAIRAAVYKSNKLNIKIFVVPGSSYGRFVYHLMTEKESIKSAQPGKDIIKGFVVFDNSVWICDILD